MFKRTVAAIIILAAMLCTAVKVDAADAPRHTKDDTWLIYMYICGADLEEVGHAATGDIAEMQHVNLPPNVKVLIAAGGAKVWHHPTIAGLGDGMYLYSADGLIQTPRIWATRARWNSSFDTARKILPPTTES